MHKQTPDQAAAFLDTSAERFGSWVQYSDTKAGAVLIVLGLGLSDLVTNATDLVGAHNRASGWGTTATVVFVLALLAALGAVLWLGLAVFPHAPAHNPHDDSLLYIATSPLVPARRPTPPRSPGSPPTT